MRGYPFGRGQRGVFLLVLGVVLAGGFLLSAMTAFAVPMAEPGVQDIQYERIIGITLKAVSTQPPLIVSKRKEKFQWIPGKTVFLSDDEREIQPMEFFRLNKDNSVAICLNDEEFVVLVYPVDM
ncbi:MAG: hypothetical protein PWR02_1697 [Synergistales bacterium]|nr:hypothetical protein [Synergistales bacterium]